MPDEGKSTDNYSDIQDVVDSDRIEIAKESVLHCYVVIVDLMQFQIQA